MAEFPSMPLWTDAYLGDTTHLTTIEHGAYLLLLITAWRTREKRLPDDDRLLARYARMTPSQWKRIRPIIAAFFTIKDGWWIQSRLTDEANAVKQYRKKQSQAGIASALKRKGRHSTTVESGCDQVATPTPTPTPIPNEEEEDEGGGEISELESVIIAWNEMAGQNGLPEIMKLTDKRRASLNARLKEYSAKEIISAIGLIPGRPFLMGQNRRQWKANFDFLIRPNSVANILEGQYAKSDQTRSGWDF